MTCLYIPYPIPPTTPATPNTLVTGFKAPQKSPNVDTELDILVEITDPILLNPSLIVFNFPLIPLVDLLKSLNSVLTSSRLFSNLLVLNAASNTSSVKPDKPKAFPKSLELISSKESMKSVKFIPFSLLCNSPFAIFVALSPALVDLSSVCYI